MKPGVKRSAEENVQIIIRLNEKKAILEEKFKAAYCQWWIWVIAVVFGGMLGYAVIQSYGYSLLNQSHIFVVLLSIVIGCALGCFILGTVVSVNKSKVKAALRSINLELVRLGAEELQKTIENDFFSHLVRINFKYLDQYYLQTEKQADKSFNLSCIAAIVGFAVLVGGIVTMFVANTISAYITTASGVLSEFIAAVFFYLYNRTISKMSQYHQKLVLTQNINLALRLTKDMNEEAKNKAYEKLIDRLTIDINKYLTTNSDDGASGADDKKEDAKPAKA
jgi:phosphate/sulfate permease